MTKSCKSIPQGWNHHFDRRDQAAKDGRHLPRADDLLLGMSFFGDNLQCDAQTWAERLLMRLDKEKEQPGNICLAVALQRLTVNPELADFQHLCEVMVEHPDREPHLVPREEVIKRCVIYRGALGDKLALGLICGQLTSYMHEKYREHEDTGIIRHAVEMLLGITSNMPGSLSMLEEEEEYPRISRRARSWPFRAWGAELFSPLDPGFYAARKTTPVEEWGLASLMPRAGSEGVTATPAEPCRLVFDQIGNEVLSEATTVRKLLNAVLGVRLPLRQANDLPSIRLRLLQEFPHATAVIDKICNDLCPRKYVAMRPTILVGTPGCGKTTFAMRLAELLGLHARIYSCAGVHDARFAGAARAWSTGEPSMPASSIIESETANPCIILDEIEKAGIGSHNGNLLNSLLPMLEPRSAAVYFDPYIEAPIDISAVVFLGTANDASLIPMPLRDRCRILAFPKAAPGHLAALVPGILNGVVAELGVDKGWVPALDASEMALLAEHWPGGSLRALQRLVEAVVRARDDRVIYH